MSAFNVKRMAKTTIVLVALAAVVGGYKYFSVNGPLISQARQLDTRMEEAKKLGIPMSPEELDTPDRLKRVELHEQFLAFDRFLADKRDLLDSDKDADKLCELLYANPDQLKNLLDACTLENVDTPINWDGGVRHAPPDYAPYSRYASITSKLARYNLAKGNTGEAIKFLKAGANLTNHLVDEPASHAVVAWTSCSNTVLRTAYLMLESDPRDPELLVGVKQAAEAVSPPNSLKFAVKGDSLLFSITARKFSAMSDEEQRALQLADESKRIDPPTGRFAGKAIESRALGYWIEAMASATPEDGNVQNAGYVIDDIGAQWVLDGGPADYLSGALPMTYEQMGTGIMRTAQLRSLVLSTVSLLSSWQQNGSLPQSLAKDDPYANDPITGKQLVYKPNGKSFVLQAIGSVDAAQAKPPVGDLRLVSGQGYGLTFELP